MKLLHIVRTRPQESVRALIDGMSRGEESREVQLFAGPVDYARLVQDIFESDMVICWW